MCRYMFATESLYDILPPASGYMNRCVYSGDDAMASTTSRTVIRPLLSWRTQLVLAASGCRSSIWRYSSFTTCCASVVQGCCAATAAGKSRAQVTIAAARYIHIPLSSPLLLCASGLVPSGRAGPVEKWTSIRLSHHKPKCQRTSGGLIARLGTAGTSD